MKISKKLKITAIIITFCMSVWGQSIEEYINKAQNFNQAGDFKQAAKVMEEAIQKFPDNATAYSYLGLYRGTQAGQTSNYLEAGRLIGSAYEMLDKAVALDANSPIARLNRGLMGVKVPSFLGRLEPGIADLEYIVKMYQVSPDKIPANLIASAYNFLGEGYSKCKETENARTAWEKVTELAPGTPLAESARQNLARISQPAVTTTVETKQPSTAEIDQLKEALKKNPNNSGLYIQLGQAYIGTGDYEEAIKVLKKGIALDSTNVNAYLLLINAVSKVASIGYDSRIHDDTNFRTNQAFEIANLAEKAVKIAPDNLELLLIRGRIGVMMPFFVGKLDQAIKDLEKVRQGTVSDETKAEAIYWLGYAYQKKATTSWIDIIKNYSETGASKMAFESMTPPVKHFNAEDYCKPFIVVDFVMGFRDELAPQTVVWVEDNAGNFVKTVYVSGFSAFAKEKQINLPRWAKSSNFQDVDGVTGASIDLGHHIYVWDLKNSAGKPVKAGEYVVKIEVSYWPSMEYQAIAAPITIGKKGGKAVVKEGNLIPYLEVNYVVK